MPNSLNVGWEAVDLHNSGASKVVRPPARDIRITGFQISVSMAPHNQVWGICELLANCTIAPPGSEVVFGSNFDYPGFSPPLINPDFSPDETSNPTGASVAGFIGYSGYLFSTILKKTQPDGANQCIVRDGLNILVPAGSVLVFHMDHAGDANTADCEMQGVINYE